jgi:hypothetical protein
MNPIAIYPYKEDPEIRKMRVQAWFRAVSLASKMTPRELEKRFSESESDRKVKRSCVWDKYRRGEVVPRSGPRPDGGLNLVDRVEAAYPGTAKWLTLPLWRLLDKAPMEMSEIRRCYESLPRPLRAMFIHPDATESSVFWRRREMDCKSGGDTLLRFANLEGFTAVLAMLRETESAQNQREYRICRQQVQEYMCRLAKHPVVGKSMHRHEAYCLSKPMFGLAEDPNSV